MVGSFRLANHYVPLEVIYDSNFPFYNFNIVLGTTLHFYSNSCFLLCIVTIVPSKSQIAAVFIYGDTDAQVGQKCWSVLGPLVEQVEVS